MGQHLSRPMEQSFQSRHSFEVRDAEPEPSPEGASDPRPKAWVIIANWGNLLAGIILMAAFLEGALINSCEWKPLLNPTISKPGQPVPNDRALWWLQFLLTVEGVLYAIAGWFMVGIMAVTPPAFGGGPRGCMQFAVLMLGGVFFALSGNDFPPCITNVTYLFSQEPCGHPAANGSPYEWNAMAHWGIACFMLGTVVGFSGVLGAPKDKFVSAFWGVTMFFLGAWTIGIFKIWGPVLLGGFSHSKEFDFAAPSVTYTTPWWIALLGAGFLTVGAAIFLLMG